MARYDMDSLIMARDDGRNAAAWSVVMENYDEIKRYADQMASKTLTVDADELLNEGLVTILAFFDHFNPEKGSAAKWCYWQVRRACTSLLREAGSDRRVLCGMSPATPDRLAYVVHVGAGDAGRIEAQAEARKIMARATPEERAAIESKASGLSGPEVKEAMGLSMAARNQRIYRFRRRIETQEKA